MLAQRRRRWADVAYMLSLNNFIVFTGEYSDIYIYIIHHNVGPITKHSRLLDLALYSLVISHT